jgi:hypothetical protein
MVTAVSSSARSADLPGASRSRCRFFQKPTARPARYAAPSAVDSVTFGARRDAEDVRLELHEQVVARTAPPSTRSSFSANARGRCASRPAGRRPDSAMLSSAARARCAGTRVAREPTIAPRAYWIPVRSAETRRTRARGTTPSLSFTELRELLHVLAPRNESDEAVAQPLHHGPADEHAAFERVFGACRSSTPRW